ncbi:ATP-binding protein [Algoriphagus sp. NBT04N3]|jgi:uncharacterized protein|uniref:AAA family ATPase n=1 Tax=Algoriphagus sp. NBT04N3 TaxID=2705473 RepID=UPI001C628081|nr:ATP-binding protein [Algoriphagus sp. NBT04N3]QYH40552.1 ATP-binding protein [Algoriphagus sp. NBT04N3]
MLLKFTIGNFKSIHEKVSVSFLGESLKQFPENLADGPNGKKILKALAFYGPNASGKSNVVKALEFMRNFVLDSNRLYQPGQLIDIDPFRLSTVSKNAPSFFEIEFSVNGQIFRYGFEVDRESVRKEWLFFVMKTTEEFYFERVEEKIDLNNRFREGWNKKDFFRNNSLFLSTVAQLNGQICKWIYDWFSNLTIISDSNYLGFQNYTADLYRNIKIKGYLKRLFKTAGFDIDDFEVSEIDVSNQQLSILNDEIQRIIKLQVHNQLKVLTKHYVYDSSGLMVDAVSFDLRDESSGTQKFFAIAGPIVNSLMNGVPLVIDELDARLHPILTSFLVKLFCSEENSHGGQLLFVNHLTNLMNQGILRRDQIVLVSKERRSGTRLKTLHEQGVRSDASFEKDYLSGEYGALPQTMMNQLNIFSNTEKS